MKLRGNEVESGRQCEGGEGGAVGSPEAERPNLPLTHCIIQGQQRPIKGLIGARGIATDQTPEKEDSRRRFVVLLARRQFVWKVFWKKKNYKFTRISFS